MPDRHAGTSVVCSRYASFAPPDVIARLFHTVDPIPNHPPSWNVAPNQDAMVVRRHPGTGERHLDLLKWGLLPHFSKDPTNAGLPIDVRADAISKSAKFRSAFSKRRCLVPADAFYEWKLTKGGKHPYAIARQDGQPMALAGLWDWFWCKDQSVLRTFAIITTKANKMMVELADGMPAIIEQKDWATWLGDVEGDPIALLRPASNDVLKAWPASQRVNSPCNDGPDLLMPVE
jgi:putative SOS response-associated peptidase YedK